MKQIKYLALLGFFTALLVLPVTQCTETPTNTFDSVSVTTDEDFTNSTFTNEPPTTMKVNSPSLNQNNLKKVYDTLEYVQDLYVLPVVCTIGIIGNSIVASFLFEGRRSNSSFIYMFAVLLADTLSLVSDLFLLFATLLGMSSSAAVREAAANMYFWNKNFITYVLRGTAFNTLCVLSAERLMAIKYPLRLRSSMTVKKPQVFLFLSFILGVVTNIQIPLFTKIGPVYDPAKNETQYKRVYSDLYWEDKPKHDTIVLILHFFAGPIQIIFFSIINVLIVQGLYQNRKNLLSLKMSSSDRAKTIKNLQVKLCKIFLVLCFTNVFAFLPNSLTTIIAKLFPDLGMSIRDYSTQILLHGGNFLRILNSASDFIVMLAMSNEIRLDVKNKLLRLRPSSAYLEKETSAKTRTTDTKKLSTASHDYQTSY